MSTQKRRKEIIEILNPNSELKEWKDWKWQLSHSVKNIDTLEKILNIDFTEKEKESFAKTIDKFPFSSTPYYLSLIDEKDYKNDPVFIQSVPDERELDISECEMGDPLHEDKDSPAPCITHRYPDRVLFLVSNVCSLYCRHCTRKRKVGDNDYIPEKALILKGIEYIKEHTEIRDVLLSGGDPFMLSDEYIDWILTELEKIDHIEIIRIGTRIPVVLPYRVTDGLIKVLKKHSPIWINTHFNHPREITESSKAALAKLADAGIPLGNQSVLLAGVNDCPRIMKNLVHKLVQNRVRPYYMYQCDLSEGLSHFRTPVGKGIEIIESLIGHTSGFAVPRYVIDAPGGGGKIPVSPNYLISWSTNKVILRNYEGIITSYQEPESYNKNFCDRDCKNCNLTLNLKDAEEYKAIGITQLLDDKDKKISLTPNCNERYQRRKSKKKLKDKKEKIKNTLINFGPENKRIYVLKIAEQDMPEIIDDFYNLAYDEQLGKIIAKVPTSMYGYFLENGYDKEAFVPKFYKGKENVYFMAKYLNENRKKDEKLEEVNNILYNLKNEETIKKELSSQYEIKMLDKSYVDKISELYDDVFETYPFPINESQYIEKSMDENVLYFGILKNEEVIALSSAELDIKNENAEMTDFATNPEYRKKGFANLLLQEMEEEMKRIKIKTLYTIARGISRGMNKVFMSNDYEFGGTLINNTNISGSIESMNVWHKELN